jgi:metal-responsive CopG/Arc/MetJ family transcriptional regulator
MNLKSRRTIRRSVALPSDLVDEVQALAPPELRENFNRLVIVALSDFSRKRRNEKLEKAMAEMASDPAIREECDTITEEFTETENDGIS